MQTIREFLAGHPEYALVGVGKRQRSRIVDPLVLALLPEELAAESMAVAAGSGRTSPNQTRTHRQCTKCQRVLRNDLFYQPESYARRGLVFPRCLDCTRNRNVGSYASSANAVQTKSALWRYLAGSCTLCGHADSWRAMAIYRSRTDAEHFGRLVDQLVSSPTVHKAEQLLKAIDGGVPLCRNCLARLQGGEIALPDGIARPRWQLVRVMDLLGLGNDAGVRAN